MAKFIEDTAKWRELDQTLIELRGKFADFPAEQLQALIDEAVAAARVPAPEKAG